jgi:hypothetical protein
VKPDLHTTLSRLVTAVAIGSAGDALRLRNTPDEPAQTIARSVSHSANFYDPQLLCAISAQTMPVLTQLAPRSPRHARTSGTMRLLAVRNNSQT